MRVKSAVLASTIALGLAVGAGGPASAALLPPLPPLPPPPALPALPPPPALPAPLPPIGTPMPNPIPPELAAQVQPICTAVAEAMTAQGQDRQAIDLVCNLALYGGSGFYLTLLLAAPAFLCFTLAQAGYDDPELQASCRQLAFYVQPYTRQLYFVLEPYIGTLP